MPPAYAILYEQQYLDDLGEIDAFDIPLVRDALIQLQHQAELPTRNRRPLATAISCALRRRGNSGSASTACSIAWMAAWSRSFG
jgi:hypothetical protein